MRHNIYNIREGSEGARKKRRKEFKAQFAQPHGKYPTLVGAAIGNVHTWCILYYKTASICDVGNQSRQL